jgi:hypothetical protein
MKICSYEDLDKEAYDNWQRMLKEGIVQVIFNDTNLHMPHVFGANEEEGTVEVAVLTEEGHLKADPKHPEKIMIDHGRRAAHNAKLKEAGKEPLQPGAIAPKSRKHKVLPGRVLTKTRKGKVEIIVLERVAVPTEDKKP